MSPSHSASEGKEQAIPWDGMDFLGRLRFILANRDLFLSLRLVTESEMVLAQAIKEDELEYILEREDSPIFTSINLKKAVGEQEVDHHRDNLKAALGFLS